MTKGATFWLEIGKTFLVAALIVIPIRLFIFQPFLVRGSSMEPSFWQNDYLIVDQVSYRFRSPKRGEVIVFNALESNREFIKRIIGLPGERVIIEDGEISIKDGDEVALEDKDYLQKKTSGEVDLKLDENEYFVLGDNRDASRDSRRWGALPEKNIIGRVLFHLSPHSIFARAHLLPLSY